MYTKITKSSFIQAFDYAGRGNQFSNTALMFLFDYIEEMEECHGEQIELDVIALCCEYEETSTEDLCVAFGFDEADPEIDEKIINELNNSTIYIGKTIGAYLFASY